MSQHAGQFKHLGDFSAAPTAHSRLMFCYNCRVSWLGCWDNFQCPICYEGDPPTSELNLKGLFIKGDVK